MHQRAQQFAERASDHALFPPHDLRLERFESGHGQPAQLPFVHAVERSGGKAGYRQVVDDRLEGTAAARAQLAGNGQLRARRAAIFLRGE